MFCKCFILHASLILVPVRQTGDEDRRRRVREYVFVDTSPQRAQGGYRRRRQNNVVVVAGVQHAVDVQRLAQRAGRTAFLVRSCELRQVKG